MSTLRKDPISHRWAIIAEERSVRPNDFHGSTTEQQTDRCPFCEGNESETMPEVHAFRQPGSQANKEGWLIRTVTNKFAALGQNGQHRGNGSKLFKEIPGEGVHEVIIETPLHDARLAWFSTEKLQDILKTYRTRMMDLMTDSNTRYIQIIRNCGPEAGATLKHPHTQLLGLEIIPDWIKAELNHANRYFKVHEKCLYCTTIETERINDTRLIYENNHFIACTMFAPRFPYEYQIFPKEHCHDFRLITDEQLFDLAIILKRTLLAIDQTLHEPPFNLTLCTSPNYPKQGNGTPHIKQFYHWRFDITPRMTNLSAFELGTGIYINPTSPEQAAQELRSALI